MNERLPLSRFSKRLVLLLADLVMIPAALWSALYLRLGEVLPPIIDPIAWWLFLIAPLTAIPLFIYLGLYRAVIRYSGNQLVWVVVQGVSLSALVLAFSAFMLGHLSLPRSSFVIYWLFGLLYIGGSRFLLQASLHLLSVANHPGQPVLIYGAGGAGAQLVSALVQGRDYKPMGIIDDDPSLHGSTIHGLQVYSPEQLPTLIDDLDIEEVFLAILNIDTRRRTAIIERLEPLEVHLRTVPDMAELISGHATIGQLRDIDIADLLGRAQVAPDDELLHHCITGKRVLVTGAGGSIGSELCRQIVRLAPESLVLFELSEYALYQIHQELAHICKVRGYQLQLIPLLGNVRDAELCARVLTAYAIQTLYHAAAYKHVPLVEHNVIEGMRNNVFGTWTLAHAAEQCGVETFILISTDKAVRPTNVMGASKRLAELVLQALATREGQRTRFTMVRFGNVLGSSGSVVPLFREQIRAGGPVTVTHPEIIRYFMTIPEAAQLVIQAGSLAEGGDVFVLDMGEPVKIVDLAKRMIHLMGESVRDSDNPHGIELQFTGLRPGEKLYEELLIGDKVIETANPRILRAEEVRLDYAELQACMTALEQAFAANDIVAVRTELSRRVNGYRAAEQIEDHTWLAEQA